MATPKTLLLATAFATIISFPAFATDAPSVAPLDATAAPADMSATAPSPSEEDVAPTMAPAPDMGADVATPEPTTIEPAPTVTEPAPVTETAAPDTPAPTTETATPAEPVAEPAVVAEPAPVKKKVSPPAKLSALSKKYDLMSLDTDNNKSLSKSEFTADGFANAKVFNRFDADHNGKLTNSEINAYASVIEANSKK